MPTLKTAHPAKPTSHRSKPFLQEDLFSCTHT